MNVVKFFGAEAKHLSEISEEQLARYQAANPEMNITRERIKVYRASTEAVDRSRDKMMADGWKLDNYKANPVFLMSHERKSVPVGRTIDSIITTYEGVKGLYLFVYFPTKDISEKSEEAFQAVNSGLMTACSVGFRPIKYEWIDTPEQAEKYNMPMGGMIFHEQELTECSMVSVPDNQEAGVVKSMAQDLFERTFQNAKEETPVEVPPVATPEVVVPVVPVIETVVPPAPTEQEIAEAEAKASEEEFYKSIAETFGNKVKEEDFYKLLIG